MVDGKLDVFVLLVRLFSSNDMKEPLQRFEDGDWPVKTYEAP